MALVFALFLLALSIGSIGRLDNTVNAQAPRTPTDPIVFDAPLQWHTIHIVSGAVNGVVFAYSDTTGGEPYKLFGCVNSSVPSRRFKQKGGRVVAFAKAACDWKARSLPIRGTQNGNGWDFEIDALNNGTYSMKVRYEF
jgi:hypothetical protein